MNHIIGSSPTPKGPHTQLRVLCVKAGAATPRGVDEIARLDITVDSNEFSIGQVTWDSFRDGSMPGAGNRPTCNPGTLAHAIWDPMPPDVLVAHDLRATRALFPATLTGRLPWLSTESVARFAWPAAPAFGLGDLAAFRNLQDQVEAGLDYAPAAFLDVLMTAHLLKELYNDAPALDVLSDENVRKMEALFDDLSPDPIVAHMLKLTVDGAMPGKYPPGPWDPDDAWTGVPLNDLLVFAGSPYSELSGAMAEAEMNRRAKRGDCFAMDAYRPGAILRRALT